MKMSLKWINEFVAVDDFYNRPDSLAEILTRAGLEVESIENQARNFSHVYVGLILEKDKHPGADKLSLCRVTTGEGVVHQIVCGAQNHKSGDKVVVALPGAILPGNLQIQKSVIRGVESSGMLCSRKELGLATESNGIEILPGSAPLGVPFADFEGFNDIIMELKVTPNRADCLSHFGLAREISCLLSRPLKDFVARDQKEFSFSTRDMISIEVTSELCPRYMGSFLKGVRVGPSPTWLQKRLESLGLKSINNVVDVTNWVMLELGQPLHAFDAQKIHGKKIIVGLAKAGEAFTTLDGSSLKLQGGELCIRDQNEALCIAGVIGGQNSGISEATTEVFLESASFNANSVRKTSRQLGVSTDSSYRFSRGTDPAMCALALNRASQLLQELTECQVGDQAWDHYPNPVQRPAISVSLEEVSERLGYNAEAHKWRDFLLRSQCQVSETPTGGYLVTPPGFRFDLEQPVDLVEEYARLNGYEHIPESLPNFNQFPSSHDSAFFLKRKSCQVWQNLGFHQAVNFSLTHSLKESEFVGPRGMEFFGLEFPKEAIHLLNPLSEELQGMKRILTFGLWQNCLRNYHRGVDQGRLYEIGSVFSKSGEYRETTRLAVVMWGEEFGLYKNQSPCVLQLKESFLRFVNEWGVADLHLAPVSDRGEIPQFLHRGQCARIQVGNKPIGMIGSLHPILAEQEKIRVPVAFLEIDLQAVLGQAKSPDKVQSPSTTPQVLRDLSLVVPKSLIAANLTDFILKFSVKEFSPGLEVTFCRVFDVFENASLGVGHRSISLRYGLRGQETLQDELLDKIQSGIIAGLSEKYSVSLR